MHQIRVFYLTRHYPILLFQCKYWKKNNKINLNFYYPYSTDNAQLHSLCLFPSPADFIVGGRDPQHYGDFKAKTRCFTAIPFSLPGIWSPFSGRRDK